MMSRISATLGLSLLLGCTMTKSNGEATPQPEAKPAEKKPAPERKMTDRAKAAIDELVDAQAPEAKRIAAARQLASLADPATVTPMLVVLEGEISEPLAAEIRKTLEAVGAGKVLAGDLAGGDDATRAEAAALLGRLRDPSSIAPLMTALSDPAPKVRENAAGTLGILGAKQAEAALIERLEKDSAPDVRGAAAQALGMLATETAEAALRRALAAEKDAFVKVLIEQGIAQIEAR